MQLKEKSQNSYSSTLLKPDEMWKKSEDTLRWTTEERDYQGEDRNIQLV